MVVRRLEIQQECAARTIAMQARDAYAERVRTAMAVRGVIHAAQNKILVLAFSRSPCALNQPIRNPTSRKAANVLGKKGNPREGADQCQRNPRL